MKRFFVITAMLSLLSVGAFAQDVASQNVMPSYKYRVYLTDKKDSKYSTRRPEEFLSPRAIERRKRQGIKITESDLPVNGTYLDRLRQQGVEVLHTSKWNNTALVQLKDTTVMQSVLALPCVKSVRKVATYSRPQQYGSRNQRLNREMPVSNPNVTHFGIGVEQIEQLNGDMLHFAGFKGQGMVIAIIDGGFNNADVIPAFTKTKILGEKDFAAKNSNVYEEGDHGMMVLACMGTNIPGWMVGTAPEASYWLLRSEDSFTEQLVEEDNWCAAIEFADSVGADVVNTSLGYSDFDNDEDDLTHEMLDGKHEMISLSASMVASKGMVLCGSAGNSGSGPWKKITAPADATDMLTVGAVNFDGTYTPFSSIGYTADGRVKPDVMALGNTCSLLNSAGNLSLASGTSFASPIMCGMVTCLWQALPHLNAYQIMELVRQSGDRYENPDDHFGYGIPNFFRAYKEGLLVE